MQDSRSSAGRAPLTDSAWFWAYLFATAALVALILAGPRYLDRQTQLEHQFSARQSAGQVVTGPAGPLPPSSDGRMIISLRPLYGVLGVILSIAWGGLWLQRFRSRRQLHPEVPSAPVNL
jgi:hypothetical protein